MSIELRLCVTLADCMELNDFLRMSAGTYPALYTWDPRRWEGLLFHRNNDELVATRAQVARDTVIARRDGQIVGALTCEYEGGVFLQCAPSDMEVQKALIDFAVANLRQKNEDGSAWLEIWCRDGDDSRASYLEALSFVPRADHQFVRTRRDSLADVHALPDGYTVRGFNTDDDVEFQRMADLLNAAFDRDFHSAEEFRNFSVLAPSFEADLQVVVVAPDGSFAATAGFTIFRDYSYGEMEPVCTHPGHQNLGLARVAIAEGLNRCVAAGIETLYVGAWYSNPVSNHVYGSMGFGNPVADRIWRREWAA
jgi:GNAT superfamily N-acetyltransferase